jgi:aminobenzoyl-glutamate utilization protein B
MMFYNRFKFLWITGVILIFFLTFSPVQADTEINREKKWALDWLSQPDVVKKFGHISDAVWSYAELGMQEFRSSKLLADTLENAGFTVERGAAGMPTCFVATYGTGKPVIGILGEFDALPMLSQKGRVPQHDPVVEGAPGHGCGHNTMCTAAAAAAIAVKQVMDEFELTGTIKVFGSPAEETVVSRPYMVRAGLFEGVDAVIDNHSSSTLSTGYGKGGNALYSTIFTFKGKTSHGASPWSGRSALDAVEIMNLATNYLREHLFYTYRMHYVVLEGGEAPNVVPDKASVWYYVRNSDERLRDMYQRVIDCARAGALASGTELVETRVISAIHQRNSNKGMAELLFRNMELVGMPEWSEEEEEFARMLQKELGVEEQGMPEKIGGIQNYNEQRFVGGGSSDVGEVTRVAPTATLRFPGQVPGTISHHWSLVACNYGTTAWKGLNTGAKVMAAAALDLFMRPEELKKIREEFEAFQKEHPYEPFLPEDSVPPLDLNEDLMEKWRPEMKPHYLEIETPDENK